MRLLLGEQTTKCHSPPHTNLHNFQHDTFKSHLTFPNFIPSISQKLVMPTSSRFILQYSRLNIKINIKRWNNFNFNQEMRNELQETNTLASIIVSFSNKLSNKLAGRKFRCWSSGSEFRLMSFLCDYCGVYWSLSLQCDRVCKCMIDASPMRGWSLTYSPTIFWIVHRIWRCFNQLTGDLIVHRNWRIVNQLTSEVVLH
jgi:hypothetical protein